MENTELYFTIQIYSLYAMIALLGITLFVMGIAYIFSKWWERRHK